MATRKDRQTKTKPKANLCEPKSIYTHSAPSPQERLAPYVPRKYQVTMGTGEEIADWLRAVPATTRAILIKFETEEDYRAHSQALWFFSQNLPYIATEILRR